MCVKPIRLKKGTTVPCGHCFECRAKLTNEWTARVCVEYANNKDCCFLTLTYNEEFIPKDGLLQKADYQKFLKRLRKFLKGKKIKYFLSGEYGGKNLRPHFHIIIFGWRPDDCFLFRITHKGEALFRSPTVEKLWTLGYSSVGLDFNPKTVRYLCKYFQKSFYKNNVKYKPFVAMSLKPAIGSSALNDNMLNTDRLYYAGRSLPLPRYYLKKLEVKYPDEVFILKAKRIIDFKQRNPDFDLCIKSIDNRLEKFEKSFSKKILDVSIYEW